MKKLIYIFPIFILIFSQFTCATSLNLISEKKFATDTVLSLAYINETDTIIGGSVEGHIYFFNSNLEINKDIKMGDTVFTVCVRNGYIFVGDMNGKIHVMDYYGNELKNLSWNEGVIRLDVQPGGNIIAAGYGKDSAETIVFWDYEKEEVLRVIHDGEVITTSIQWSPDGKLLATSNTEGAVSLWSAETLSVVKSYLAHKEAIWSISWSHDGNYLSTCGVDSLVKVWSKDGEMIYLLAKHEKDVLASAWSADDRFLATGDWDGYILLWNMKEGKFEKKILAHDRNIVNIMYLNEKIISTSWDGKVKMWSVSISESYAEKEIWQDLLLITILGIIVAAVAYRLSTKS